MAKEPVDVIEVGRLFHKRGPKTADDRSPAAVFERGTNRRPDLVDRRCRLAVADDDVIRKEIGRRAVNALIRHDGHLKSYTLLDWCVSPSEGPSYYFLHSYENFYILYHVRSPRLNTIFVMNTYSLRRSCKRDKKSS